MDTYRDTWTSGSIRPISLEMKTDNQGGLIQLDFAMSGVHEYRAVMDRDEFASFMQALESFSNRVAVLFDKLPPGELDPRD